MSGFYLAIILVFLIGTGGMLQPWKPTSGILLESWTISNAKNLPTYRFTVSHSLPSGNYNCTFDAPDQAHYRYQPGDTVGGSNAIWFNQYYPTQCCMLEDISIALFGFIIACIAAVIEGIIILLVIAICIGTCFIKPQNSEESTNVV